MLAVKAAQKREELHRKSSGSSKHKRDLGDVNKWGLKDVQQFGMVMKEYQKDIVEIKTTIDRHKDALKDIKSNMLKCMCYSSLILD